jgi:import inner membrane translocase subunit TIM22
MSSSDSMSSSGDGGGNTNKIIEGQGQGQAPDSTNDTTNDENNVDSHAGVNSHMTPSGVDPFQGKSIYDIMMLSQGGRASPPLHQSQSQSQSQHRGSNLTTRRSVQPTAIQHDFYYSYEKALAAPSQSSQYQSQSGNNNINHDAFAPSALAIPHSDHRTGAGVPVKKLSYLPYHLPWQPVAGPTETPVNNGWLMESCAGKAAIGIFGGGVMGLIMGVFLGAMSDMTPPVTVINGKEVPQAPLKEQVKTTMRATGQKSLYWCRQFAFITGVFSGTECVFEKARGKHDVWNEVLGGCVTGAAIQGKHGPQAAAVGCGGFAAFSLVIAQVMGTHS